MPHFVPSGYTPVREALDRLGRELFQQAWTGEEYKARRGLISPDEWARIKDLPPPRGGGAQGSNVGRGVARPLNRGPSDPADPAYQREFRARERYESAVLRLRQFLESGELEGAILDPWTGELHTVSRSLWRLHDADRMIEKGQAPIPGSRNVGSILTKRITEPSVGQKKPLPAAKIAEAIRLLKEKTAAESLTRPQQKDLLRQSYPNYDITERVFRQVFEAIPTKTGRPKKSHK